MTSYDGAHVHLHMYTHVRVQDALTFVVGSFSDSEVVKLTSIQLVSAMELLVSHTSLWSTSLVSDDTESVKEMSSRINNTVRDLGKELVLFLQVYIHLSCIVQSPERASCTRQSCLESAAAHLSITKSYSTGL